MADIGMGYLQVEDSKQIPQMAKVLFLLLPLFLFIGCSIKEQILASKTSHITLLTKELKYSDVGFIKKSRDSIVLELYSFGNPTLKLTIKKDNICLEGSCYPKIRFIERFFSSAYYPEILEDILLRRGIFGKNLDGEISQHIKLENRYDITYSVDKNGDTIFIDTFNKIKILIKEI